MEASLDIQNDYKVSLDVFEGPLDLLLYLIRKNEVDVYNIPITPILTEYLEYMEQARSLDIDLASDFLEMAAELVLIKSQMLMPSEDADAAEEGPDPREELARRLLEYQRYKKAGKELACRPLLGKDVFKRGKVETEGERDLEADLGSLLVAFQYILKRLPKEGTYEVRGNWISVSEKIVELTERLKTGSEFRFHELFDMAFGRLNAIVVFLAILEMTRMRIISIRQGKTYDEIFIASHVTDDVSSTEVTNE